MSNHCLFIVMSCFVIVVSGIANPPSFSFVNEDRATGFGGNFVIGIDPRPVSIQLQLHVRRLPVFQQNLANGELEGGRRGEGGEWAVEGDQYDGTMVIREWLRRGRRSMRYRTEVIRMGRG